MTRPLWILAACWGAVVGGWSQEPDWNGQIRESLAGLGMVEGAYYDADAQSVVLLGNGEHPEASPSPEQVAVAIRWAFADEPGDPFVSIDPIEGDPEGPYMKIRIDDFARDTRFGWVMFEADRLLKGYSLGQDNLSHVPVESGVKGYQSIFGWSDQFPGARSGTPVWSRFWFRPARTDVQEDATAMRILTCRLRVETEIMFLKNGKMESSGGKQDPAADAFAEHFTEHYQEYAAEEPVFLELEQQCRLLLVSEWIRNLREQNLPVNLAWVTGWGGPFFPMAAYTPSLRVSRTRKYEEGNSIITEMAQLFGGVELKVKPQRVPVSPAFKTWQSGLKPKLPGQPGKAVRFLQGEKPVVAAALPGRASQAPGFKPERMLAARLPNGEAQSLALRPQQTGRNQLADGSGRELALPDLRSYAPNGRRTYDGKPGFTEFTGVQGKPETKLTVREYELTSPEGERIAWFSEHEIDQGSATMFVKPRGDSAPGWTLAPDRVNNQAMWAAENGQRRWGFSMPGGEIIAEQKGETLLRYRYNSAGAVERVETANGDLVFELKHSHGGARLAGVKTADGQYQDLLGTMRSELRNLPEEIPLKLSVYGNEMPSVFRAGAAEKWTFPGEVPGQAEAVRLLQRYESEWVQYLARAEPGVTHVHVVPAGGYTLLMMPGRIEIVADSINGLQKAAGKAQRLGAKSDWKRALDAIVKEVPNNQVVITSEEISHANDVGRLVAASLPSGGAKANLFVSDNLKVAGPNVRSISTGLRNWGSGDSQVIVFTDTLSHQAGASNVLRGLGEMYDVSRAVPSSEAGVVFVVYHSVADIEGLLLSKAEFFRGKLVVGLGCRPEGAIQATANLARSVKNTGAQAVVTAPRFLHSGAAKAITEAQKTVSERGGPARSALEYLDEVIQEAKKKVTPGSAESEEILRSIEALEEALKKPTAMRQILFIPIG